MSPPSNSSANRPRHVLDIGDLSASDIHAVWALAEQAVTPCHGTAGYSFEGNGVRTRTTFLQAFQSLSLGCIDLPNLLKTKERACDLAGYLDPFYSLYVIRDSDHDRLSSFAQASRRPVINAMSSQAHPCEVLADAFSLHSDDKPIEQLRIGLWGPPTNVLRSWHSLAKVMGLTLHHFCPAELHTDLPGVVFTDRVETGLDVLVTDSWPTGFERPDWSLTAGHLALLGQPRLLPTPPFYIGKELAFDPLTYAGFMGYGQKQALLKVQRALIQYLLPTDQR
jgi:ornithine carbamoyltransferase